MYQSKDTLIFNDLILQAVAFTDRYYAGNQRLAEAVTAYMIDKDPVATQELLNMAESEYNESITYLTEDLSRSAFHNSVNRSILTVEKCREQWV